MLRTAVIASAITLTGCVVSVGDKPVKQKPVEYVWVNPAIDRMIEVGQATEHDIQSEFQIIKAQCNIESQKIPIPPPSCTQPPKQNCDGMTAMAKGFCQGFTPPPQCNYSSVNAAYNAQNQVFESCMTLGGWAKVVKGEPYTPPADTQPVENNAPIEEPQNDPVRDAVVQSAIDAIPILAQWQKEDGENWALAGAIDTELKAKPEYRDMLLVERFRIVVEKVQEIQSRKNISSNSI